MKESLFAFMSPMNVVKDMFKVKGYYGFKEESVKSINRKIYSNNVKDTEHGTINNIKKTLDRNDWNHIRKDSCNLYFAEERILTGQRNSDITNENIFRLY
jgi:hypothetical protein